MGKNIKETLQALVDCLINKTCEFEASGLEAETSGELFDCTAKRTTWSCRKRDDGKNSHWLMILKNSQFSEIEVLYFTSPDHNQLFLSVFVSTDQDRQIGDTEEKSKFLQEKRKRWKEILFQRTMLPLEKLNLNEHVWEGTSFQNYYEPRIVFAKAYQLEGDEGARKIPDGVDYQADLQDAIDICEQAKDYYESVEQRETSFDHNMILYGPPGTGKTYQTAIYAVAIAMGEPVEYLEKQPYEFVMMRYRKLKAEGKIAFTTFHQSYGYEEFMEGIVPETDENGQIHYLKKDGVFKAFCKQARQDSNPRIFVIDEINRGNISKIFGELITLIEDTKREGMKESISVTLPYSGEIFAVPQNVYLLGTMNTADRSIAMMDTALRRRFRFVEMMPRPELLEEIKITDENREEPLNLKKLLETINTRIEYLYDREHTIGHAFFMKLKEIKDEKEKLTCLGEIFRKSVIPLLQEYFFEDYRKIQYVLGDNGKDQEDEKFIKEGKDRMSDIFKGVIPESIENEFAYDDAQKRYKINEEAFDHIESYLHIM